MTPNDKLKIGDRMAWLTMSTDPRGDEEEGPETKCGHCGHMRWEHSVYDRPRHCQHAYCNCRSYERFPAKAGAAREN